MWWAKNGAKKSSQNVWRIKIKRYLFTRNREMNNTSREQQRFLEIIF